MPIWSPRPRPWRDAFSTIAACIDISRNSAPVATLSTAQVREGIHERAMGEWRRYAVQLAPLSAELEK